MPIRKIARLLQPRGGLRTDVPVEEMAMTLWLLTSPYQHEHLVVQAGWAADRYLAWLQRVLVEAVLAPGEGSPAAPTLRRRPD
ncbi:MAG: hypothetical protein QOH19_2222 [Actinomycetota bacterium]|jgi:hypothetical protein|nr:hypothetical protein [Actinomycetota bacterium]